MKPRREIAMPSRVWSHLCDYATIDAMGKPTIIGEFDRIFSQSVPAKHPLLFVISKWSGAENETFNEQVKIVSPNKSQIAAGPLNAMRITKATEGIGNAISIGMFMMVDFPKFGEYSIEILIDNIPVHILPLFVSEPPK